MTDAQQRMREAAARALIDVDPCVDGYCDDHIAMKMPDVDAVARVVLGVAANVAGDSVDPWPAHHNEAERSGYNMACDHIAAAIRALGTGGEDE